MPYVFSTITNSLQYCSFEKRSLGNDRHAVIKKKVLIEGGHGVATVSTSECPRIHTPNGVATYVSDEDLEFLLQNKSFQRHIERKFITHDKKETTLTVKVKDMTPKDGSAPKTPADYKAGSYSDDQLQTFAAPKVA